MTIISIFKKPPVIDKKLTIESVAQVEELAKIIATYGLDEIQVGPITIKKSFHPLPELAVKKEALIDWNN